MKERKKQLRLAQLLLYRDIPREELVVSNKKILAHLWSLEEFRQAKTVFVYHSVGREVETRPIMEKLWAQGKNVALPLCFGKGRMEARLVTSVSDLEPGFAGIPSPKKECPLAKAVDLVLVLCVACDKKGNRLGQGGGYYDRFLAENPLPAIVLCRKSQLVEEVPTEAWDISFDRILTEEGVLKQK